MKNIAFFFVLLFPFLSFAQPDKGDYIMVTWPDRADAHYIFKKSQKVYYGYVAATNESETSYKVSSESVQDLFAYADSIDFPSIKELDEKKLTPAQDGIGYRILEYRKDEKIYRICFDEYADDEKYHLLSRMISMLNSFW